jgi:GTP-binding protein EngB required for normal cell division
MSDKYFVFTGRPNAGKSSVIREVVGLDVVVGKRPGTTRRISKYPLIRGLVLVDTPGFGTMLGTSRHFQNKKKDELIGFLTYNAASVILAVHVLDISTFSEVTCRLENKGFISLDVEMVQFLTKTLGELPMVAANKIDKTNRQELESNLEEFKLQLGETHPFVIGEQIFPVSTRTGEGLADLKNAINSKLVAKGYKTPFIKAK